MQTSQIELVGTSPAARALRDQIGVAAKIDAKVLLTGETGSGKEVAARLIHQWSRRSASPLVTINCGGLPDTLLESELFGHQRGSFTGAYHDKLGLLETGHHGTVLLDEVGEMSLRMQTVLLRFLDSGEIHRIGSTAATSRADVRLIAATNRQLIVDVVSGSFRRDLYYRLNVIQVRVPPLRERREDVPLLVRHFARRFALEYAVPEPSVSRCVMERLVEYEWPGNIRELRNVVERLVVNAEAHPLSLDDLQLDAHAQAAPPAVETPAPRGDAVEAFEEIVLRRRSFWDVVYKPFMAHDLTRQDVRYVVRRGLEQCRGNYRILVQSLNMPAEDYSRFMSFLRKSDCHLPFLPFRKATIKQYDQDASAAETHEGGCPPEQMPAARLG